jgi:hypothetical protein
VGSGWQRLAGFTAPIIAECRSGESQNSVNVFTLA